VLSSRPEYIDAGLVVALQQPEQLAGDDAAQAPLGVASGLALSGAAGQVGASVGIDAQAHQQDGVQRAVELAVAAALDSLGRLGCQVAWLTVPLGVVRLAWGRSPRVQLRAVT
jgi:hypothetical protein